MAANIYNRVCSEVARRLNSRIIPMQKLKHADLAIQFVIDLKSSKKDPNYDLQMHDLSCAVCGLINTSGGIILIDFISSNPERLENWKDSVKGLLVPITGNDLYMSSIEQVVISDTSLEIQVNIGNQVVAVHTNFHIRDGCSSTEVRQIDLVKQTLENEKQSQYDNTPERWTNLNYGQDAVEQHESSTLEYKHFECTGVKKLLEKVTTGNPGSRLQKTLFAFANQRGGGTLIIGIQDEGGTGRKRVLGQKISQKEQAEFKCEFGKFMTRGMHGEARIWKDEDYEPCEGREWHVKFILVKNTPNNEPRYLIHINVNYFPGGVYASMPEMYKVLSDGTFTSVDYDLWKKCITSTEDEHKKYIHEIPASPSQSTSSQQSGNVHNEVPLLEGVEEYLPQLADELKDWTGKNQKDDQSISWTKHCGIWEKDRQNQKGISDVPKISELCNAEVLTPRTPISYFPPEEYLLKTDVDGILKQALQDISKYYQAKPAVAFAETSLISLFPQIHGISIPSSHVLDVFVISKDGTDACGLDVWSICQDAQSSDEHSDYLKSLLRQLKRLLQIRSNMAVTIKGFKKVLGQSDHSCIKTLSPAGKGSLELLQKTIASILLPGILLKNRFGEEYLAFLTKDQMNRVLPAAMSKLSVIDGPPGSGKTLVAFTLIEKLKREKKLKSNQIKYVCVSQALANYAKSQNLCSVGVCTGKNLIKMIQEDIDSGVCFFVFDDGHWIRCKLEQWEELCEIVNKTKDLQVAIFQDSAYQNYGHQNDDMMDAFHAYKKKHRHFPYHTYGAPPEMLRNSLTIFSFFKANAEEDGEELEWSHNVLGGDVRIHYHKSYHLKTQSRDNPIIKIVGGLLKNVCHGHFYRECDIAILVGSFILRRRDLIKSIENALKELCGITVQKASEIPAKLMVLDSLRNFVGLDSKCCIVIMDEDSINDTKLKLFSVSRGIMHVEFILAYNDDKFISTSDGKREKYKGDKYSATERMHISQEDVWNKKSMELVHHLHRQLSHHGGMNDRQELSLQQMIPQTPKWKEFVFLLLEKQMGANKEKHHSNKRIQDCIKMMLPEAWHMDLYQYQACYLVYGHSEGSSAVQDVLGLPAQYPDKLNELIGLSGGIISSFQSADALETAVRVVLVSLRILTENPADSMNTAAVVERQLMSDTLQQVHLDALEALEAAMKESTLSKVAIQHGAVDVLLSLLKTSHEKDDKVKGKVLLVLGKLAKDNTARTQAIDGGIVDDSLKILHQQGTTNQVKLRALHLLCKVEDDSGLRPEEIVVDSFPDILTQDEIYNLMQDVLSVLDTCMRNRNRMTVATRRGVLDALLATLNHPCHNVKVKINALIVLCRGNEDRAVKTKRTDPLMVDGLLSILRYFTDNQVEGGALEMLHRMMKDTNIRTRVMPQQVFDVLLGITEICQKYPTVKETALQGLDKMKRHRTLNNEQIDQVAVDGVLEIIRQHGNDKQLQLDALKVLNRSIEKRQMGTAAAILPGVVDLLLDLMRQPRKDDVVKEQALQVLRNVKEDNPSWRKKIDHGVADGLLECLRQHTHDNQVQRDAMRVLDSMITVGRTNRMRTVVMQQGAVPLLLEILKRHNTDVSVKLVALKVLHTAKKESTALTENINQAVVDSLWEILAQHNSSNALVQGESMEVLHTAVEDSDVRTEAVRRGVVNQLLDILKLSGYDETVKLKLIEVLLTLTEDSTVKTEAISRGIVDGLLEILRQYDTDRWVQGDALGVLSTVIMGSTMLPAVIMHEVFQALLGIVEDTARAFEVQEKALEMLNTLLKNSDPRAALLQEGVVDALLRVIIHDSRRDKVQGKALKVIDTVMMYSEMRTALLQHGLVDTLLGIIAQHARDVWVQRKALEVIDTAMRYSEMRKALLQHGVVDALLEIKIHSDRHNEVQEEAMRVIDTWMKYSEMRTAFSQPGVVDVILKKITQGVRDVDSSSSAERSSVEGALRVLQTAMKYSDVRTALSQQGVVDVLLGIITQNDYVQWEALKVLQTAMKYSEMRTALLQHRLVDVLLGIITQDVISVQRKALKMIGTAMEYSEMRTALLQKGVVDVLLGIITQDVNALGVIDTMMECSEMRTALLQHGLVDAFLGIITGDRHSTDNSHSEYMYNVQEKAMRVIDTWMEYGDVRTAFSQQGVVDVLLKKITQDNKEVQMRALTVIDKVMTHNDMRTALLQHRVVDVLLRGIPQFTNRLVQMKAMEVIDTAKDYSDTRTALLQQGVVDLLLGLVTQKVTDVWVQEEAMNVIDTMLKCSEMRTALLQHGVVGVLLQIITDMDRDAEVKVLTLKALRTVNENSPVRSQEIRQTVVDGLMGILRTHDNNDRSVKIEALRVINAAMEESDTRAAFLQQGVVDALIRVITHDRKRNQAQMEALELLNTLLKYSDIRPALIQQGVMDVVLVMIKKGNRYVTVEEQALEVVNTAIMYSDIRATLLQVGVVDVVLGVITTSWRRVKLQIKALEMINTMFDYSDIRAALLEQGAVDVILAIIIEQRDRDVKLHVRRKAMEVRDTMWKYIDMVDSLLEIINRGGEDEVKVEALKAVCALLEYSPVQSEKFTQAVVHCLITILRKPDVSDVHWSALNCIDPLLSHCDMRAALLQEGVVDMLLGMIQDVKDYDVKVNALKALCTVNENCSARSQEIRQTVVDGLMEILLQDDTQLYDGENALNVLQIAMEDDDMRKALTEKGVKERLLAIIEQAEMDVSVTVIALKALCTVNEGSPARSKELDQVVIDELLDILRNKISENERQDVKVFDVIQEAADIMCRLASDDVITRSTIEPEKSLLHKFIDDSQTHSDAREAITSIESLLAMF